MGRGERARKSPTSDHKSKASLYHCHTSSERRSSRIIGEEECDPSAARSPVRHSSARAMEELVHCVRRMVQREAGLNGFCGGGPAKGLGFLLVAAM